MPRRQWTCHEKAYCRYDWSHLPNETFHRELVHPFNCSRAVRPVYSILPEKDQRNSERWTPFQKGVIRDEKKVGSRRFVEVSQLVKSSIEEHAFAQATTTYCLLTPPRHRNHRQLRQLWRRRRQHLPLKHKRAKSSWQTLCAIKNESAAPAVYDQGF